MLEPWQVANQFFAQQDREAKRILSECPECDYCGRHIDTAGVYGGEEYIEYLGSHYHKKCFKRMLNVNGVRELVVEKYGEASDEAWLIDIAEESIDDMARTGGK